VEAEPTNGDLNMGITCVLCGLFSHGASSLCRRRSSSKWVRSDRVLRSRTVRLSARPSAPGTGALVQTLSVLLGRLADAAVDLIAGA
jgi:hypothetical protein